MAAKRHTITHAEMLEHLLGVEKVNVPKILKEEERLGFSFRAAQSLLAALKYYEFHFDINYQEAVDLVKYVDHFAKRKFSEVPWYLPSLEAEDIYENCSLESDYEDENGVISEDVVEKVRTIVKKYVSDAKVLGCCKVRYIDEDGDIKFSEDNEYDVLITAPSLKNSSVVVDLDTGEIIEGVLLHDNHEYFDFECVAYDGAELINGYIEENHGYESLDPHRYDMDQITGYMYKFGLPFMEILKIIFGEGIAYNDYRYDASLSSDEVQYRAVLIRVEEKYGIPLDENPKMEEMIEILVSEEIDSSLWGGAEYYSREEIDSSAEEFFSNHPSIERDITPLMKKVLQDLLTSAFENVSVQGVDFKAQVDYRTQYDDYDYEYDCWRVYFSSDEILPTSYICLPLGWEAIDTDQIEDVMWSGLIKRVDKDTNKIYITLL